MTKDNINVVLADDHSLLLEGLKRSLDSDSQITVTATMTTINACQEWVAANPADILLLDVEMPDGNSIDYIKKITHKQPQLRVIMLSAYAEPSVIRRALDNGAAGYLMKTTNSQEIIQAIKTVVGGSMYLNAEAQTILALAPEHIVPLTPRERQVLHHVVLGLQTKEIAELLGIGYDTVHDYMKTLRIKLKAKSMPDLVRIAKEQYLV